jgi:hypothetical protein
MLLGRHGRSTTTESSFRQRFAGFKTRRRFSNGAYLLEPRVLVPPQALSARTRKMLDTVAANLKQGVASAPIDLAPFL